MHYCKRVQDVHYCKRLQGVERVCVCRTWSSCAVRSGACVCVQDLELLCSKERGVSSQVDPLWTPMALYCPLPPMQPPMDP